MFSLHLKDGRSLDVVRRQLHRYVHTCAILQVCGNFLSFVLICFLFPVRSGCLSLRRWPVSDRSVEVDDCESDRCPCLWPSAPNSRGAELQIWACSVPADPSRAEKETPGQRLRLRCREAASGLYSFNLWWMRSEERSRADKYESVWLGRSSIMPAAANGRSCGWNGSPRYKKAISQKIGMY